MLYIAGMLILSDQSIEKISFENFDFWAAQGEKLHQQVAYQSLGSPPPPAPPPPPPCAQCPNRVKSTKNGLKHALHALDDHFR